MDKNTEVMSEQQYDLLLIWPSSSVARGVEGARHVTNSCMPHSQSLTHLLQFSAGTVVSFQVKERRAEHECISDCFQYADLL